MNIEKDVKQLHSVVSVSTTTPSMPNPLKAKIPSYQEVNRGNVVKGVLIRVEEDVVFPSGKVLRSRKKVDENTMLIGGTQILTKALSGLTTGDTTVLKLDEDLGSVMTPISGTVRNEACLCGVMLCNGGANGDVVNAVERYRPGFTAANRMYWRENPAATDDISVMLQDYACRTIEGGKIRYYLKKLKGLVRLNRQVDGEITLPNRPDQSLTGDVKVESVIKGTFTIELEDLADYYANAGDPTKRKFSTVSVFIGNIVTLNVAGKTGQDHRNLTCTNQLNIEEEILRQNKEATYEYTIHVR